MSRPEDRKEILRVDCPTCGGQGYTTNGSSEAPCDPCGGSGMLEKEVDYKFDGRRSKDEIDRIFGFRTTNKRSDADTSEE